MYLMRPCIDSVVQYLQLYDSRSALIFISHSHFLSLASSTMSLLLILMILLIKNDKNCSNKVDYAYGQLTQLTTY